MEILALRHQLTVYRRSVKRLRIRSSDRLFLRWHLASYFAHYHRWRCHQSLRMDCPIPRQVQPPERGKVVEVAEAGGVYRH